MAKFRFTKSKFKKVWLTSNGGYYLFLTTLILLVFTSAVIAQDPQTTGERLKELEKSQQNIQILLNTLWVVFAGILVFFMNAGFAMLETGFCRQKNAVNLLSKNLIVFAVSTIAFWAIGFAIMFGNGTEFYGANGFFLSGADNSPTIGEDYRGVFRALKEAEIPLQAKFFFQLVFAGTSATIVSGAVAERIKFLAFLLFSLLLVSFSYPVTGHWVWGDGWLKTLGFWDFAGSTVVHSVGGSAALVGAWMLGPRLNKYQDVAMPGHNLSIATLGCLILWLGWFGFNSGSTLKADYSAITHILLTTNMAGAAGGIAATITTWIFLGQPDLSFIINGILAGLVSITASCAFVNITCAIIIGFIAGVIVVFSAIKIDNWQIDDPVGAISVHLVCGIWGTLAVGLFSVGPDIFPWYTEGPEKGLFLGGGLYQTFPQIIGIVSVVGYTILWSLIVWATLKFTIDIRVSEDDEIKGLDLSEHGMTAYGDLYFDQKIKTNSENIQSTTSTNSDSGKD